MLNGQLSWVGLGSKICYDKIDSKNVKKVFEVPFKLNDLENRYLLRIIYEKKNGRVFYNYSFFEILSEENGIIDTILIDNNVSPKNKIFSEILLHKSLRFKLIWIFGISHLFQKRK